MTRPIVAAALVLLAAACSAPGMQGDSDSDPVASDAEDIISFPAAVFSNAKVITYGATLSNIPFKASDKFTALRFQGKAGDRIEAKATPGQGEAILYLSRKVGSQYSNVRAGGQDGAAKNVVAFTLAEADTYYLVFRTMPRADATFEVSLSDAKAGGACADAGKLPTAQELAALTEAGTAPSYTTPQRTVSVERRTCLYATGCGQVEQRFQIGLPMLTFTAAKDGATWKVQATPGPWGNGQLPVDAAGRFAGKVQVDSAVEIDARGSLGLTCATVEDAITKVPVDTISYREYRVVGGAYADTVTKAERPATSAPPTVPTLAPASDEEILAFFPRGGTQVAFETPLSNGVAAGGASRSCHPLTSCSALAAGPGCNLSNVTLRRAVVTGPDSYALVLRTASSWNWDEAQVQINDGVGEWAGAKVRVTETQLQLEYPASSTPSDGVTYETGNRTCTFPLRWR